MSSILEAAHRLQHEIVEWESAEAALSRAMEGEPELLADDKFSSAASLIGRLRDELKSLRQKFANYRINTAALLVKGEPTIAQLEALDHDGRTPLLNAAESAWAELRANDQYRIKVLRRRGWKQIASGGWVPEWDEKSAYPLNLAVRAQALRDLGEMDAVFRTMGEPHASQ